MSVDKSIEELMAGMTIQGEAVEQSIEPIIEIRPPQQGDSLFSLMDPIAETLESPDGRMQIAFEDKESELRGFN